MRNASCLVLLFAAACGIQNKVSPDGAGTDGVVTGDGQGSGSNAELTIALTDKPAVLGNAAVSFAFTTSIPATTECRLDGDAYAACTSPFAPATVADGMHSFDVRATAGDQHASVPTYSFTLDTVAPAMTITGQPAMTSPVATAQFHFNSDDATTVTCALDAAAAATCTSPVSYAGLADGSHTFTLTGSDGAGNTAVKTYTWTVDTSAPMLTITMEPPDPSASTSATFQFTIGTSSTVSCQLEGAVATACTSPITYTGLSQGSQTFTLRGTNASGMTTTRTYTWTVDTVAPLATIDSGPPANTNSPTAQLAFFVTGASTVTCQLDTGTPAACTSPWTYNSVPDGAHTFTLKAVDLAGNSTTKTRDWTVDTVAPSISLTSAPSNPSNSAAAAFAFTVTGGPTTNTCQIDSAAATSCTTSASYSGLAQGNHAFTVKATDAAGNVATKNYAWLVDTIAPVLAFTATPAANANTGSAHFAFTTDDAVTITCQLDSAAAAACAGSADYTGLADGSHTFTLRGTDAASNASVKTFTWSVDTVAPTVAITGKPTDPSNDSSPSFSFSTAGATSVTCQLDGGAAAACTSPAGYASVAEGAHTFVVKASDAAGNAAQQSYTWNVDTTAPVVSFSSTPRANTNIPQAAFQFSVTGATTETCQLDGGTPFVCTTSYTSNSLPDGSHTFTVKGSDAAGNVGTATYGWNVDTVSPIVSIYSHPPAKSTSHTATFQFSDSDGTPTTCHFGIDPGQACTSPATYTLADGDYSFSVSTDDAAGNFGIDTVQFSIDATLPSVSVSYSCDTTGVTFNWSSSDANGINACTCTVNGPGGGTSACAASGSAFYYNFQNTSFSVSCTDTFGNARSASKTLTTTNINACQL